MVVMMPERQNGFAAIWSNSVLKLLDVEFQFDFWLQMFNRIHPYSLLGN
jgi:hypothetical protein